MKKEVKKAKPAKTVKQANKSDKKIQYQKAIQAIIRLNEKYILGTWDEDDPLWDVIVKARKALEGDYHNDVIGRLLLSLSGNNTVIEIDEASTPDFG